MADENRKCKHAACNCPVADDQDYCSEYCENAGDVTEIACGCEHSNCS